MVYCACFPADLFGIDEITMYKGDEWSEKTYAVAGEIVDGVSILFHFSQKLRKLNYVEEDEITVKKNYIFFILVVSLHLLFVFVTMFWFTT